MALQVAGQATSEAVRQAKIAQPVIAETCRKAKSELQHQIQLAKPVLQSSARDAVSAARNVSHQAYAMSRTAWQRTPRIIAAGMAIGLCGMTALAWTFSGNPASESVVGQAPAVEVAQDAEWIPTVEQEVHPIAEPVRRAPVSLQTMVRQVTSHVVDTAQQQRRQREEELAQRRQQAQLELDQAAAHYEYALQQWNAEVAACQQGGPPAGYSSQQMGRFAAMGVRLQPRQPNQALLHAAQQAEQRYMQVRDNYLRLSQAQ